MAKGDATTTMQNAAQNTAPGAVTTNAHHLIVIHPFGAYSKGARIEDANEIAAVLAGENAGSCNRVQASA